MFKWILPTLSEILALSESTLKDFTSAKADTNQNAVEDARAEREWCGAIAALEHLLLQSIDSGILPPPQGLVFASPAAVLSHKAKSCLPTWIFTADTLKSRAGTLFQLPPATAMQEAETSSYPAALTPNAGLVPLVTGDPLFNEQFCLVLTAEFSLVLVLGEDCTGKRAFLFSFEPEVVEQTWQALRGRLMLTSPNSVSQLDALVEQYYPVAPDYRTVAQFSRLLLKHLPEKDAAWSVESSANPHCLLPSAQSTPNRPDVELLQAFAHEVRTPLTTIRTLTRLLLKRCDLATNVIKRLEIIDHECTEQIDRMELLFRAAELETSTLKHTNTHLTAMSLAQILQHSIPRWQKQASRRNLTLDVILPQQLPSVVSDPRMLDQVLTGLIENFTRSLPAGSHIQVQVILAGDQLKLQLLPQSQPGESDTAVEWLSSPPIRKSIGQLLTFQPETGNISLNLTATKHLFQAIGGKLIVRQRPHQGEVLTIFLPLEEVSHTEFSSQGLS